MKLLVVRHAIAENRNFGGKDEDRPISPKGREKFHQICKSLIHLNLQINLLLDSPLLRSQQTADIFCEYFSVQKRDRTEQLKPFAEVSDLFLELKAYGKNFIAIVGHQPFLTSFLNYCLTGAGREFTFLKRGGMAFLDFAFSVEPGSAMLRALIQPKYLLKD